MQPPPPPVPPAPGAPATSDAASSTQLESQVQADAALTATRLAERIQALQGATSGQGAGARALPRTAQELAALRRQRTELSRQLESAQDRRQDVARALERADNPANRAGLEQRLRVLDQRIAQLETDMAATGRLVTTAPPALFATASEAARDVRIQVGNPGGRPGAVVAVMFILFGVFPLVLALSRRLWRRSADPRPDPFQRESAERLARLEQAVEAIAIEVERVSEGQRFVTRLLADSRAGPAVAAGDGVGETHDALPRYAANG